MNRARDVSVSIVQDGGDLRIWCATFKIKGPLSTDEPARRRLEKRVADALATINFPEFS